VDAAAAGAGAGVGVPGITNGTALAVKVRGGFWMRFTNTGAQPLMPQTLRTRSIGQAFALAAARSGGNAASIAVA
jgi:hypothetical protein